MSVSPTPISMMPGDIVELTVQEPTSIVIDRHLTKHGASATIRENNPLIRVYVAGSTKEVERVRRVLESARDLGWYITFDWTGVEGEIKTTGPWERGAEIAQNEIKACQDADLVILLAPKVSTGLGCWIEVGAALASDTEVWVVEPGKESVFWEHPFVTKVPTLADLYRRMIEYAQPPLIG